MLIPRSLVEFKPRSLLELKPRSEPTTFFRKERMKKEVVSLLAIEGLSQLQYYKNSYLLYNKNFSSSALSDDYLHNFNSRLFSSAKAKKTFRLFLYVFSFSEFIYSSKLFL